MGHKPYLTYGLKIIDPDLMKAVKAINEQILEQQINEDSFIFIKETLKRLERKIDDLHKDFVYWRMQNG